MIEVRYRLIFRDGSRGPWGTDKEEKERLAKFFFARIETWVVELP